MAVNTLPGGTFTMAGDLTVTRMGYGAMQLAGPHVFGPPADRDAAVAAHRQNGGAIDAIGIVIHVNPGWGRPQPFQAVRGRRRALGWAAS